MFDLFRSREKSVRYLLGALLLLVAASMVITLVPGYGGAWGAGGESDPSVLAEVGDHKVTATEVREYITREYKGQIPPGMASFFIPTIVQQMAATRAVALEAERLGIRLTDAQLAEVVRALLPQLWEGGKFAGKDIYAQFLAQQNMSIPQFEEAVRTQSLQSRLEILVLEGVIVTPRELEEEFRLRNEKIKVAYFGIEPDKVRERVKVPEEEIRAYYEKSKAGFKTPEKRALLIFPIEEAKIAAGLKIPEEQLRALYQQRQEQFRQPERVKARHILLMTTNKTPAQTAEIQKRAEALWKQIKGGGNFAELAKKNSEDPGSAPKGGELDWIVRGQTVPEFEKTAFSLKPGEMSGVIKTQYGFHIIQVEQHEQARLRPFEEVKGELAAEARRGQVIDKMQRVADQIRSALVRSQEEAVKLAAENGVAAIRSGNVAPGDPVQEVGANQEFAEAVKNLPKNGVTPVVQVAPDKLVVAQVTEVIPPGQAELADVAQRIRETLAAQRATEMSEKLVAEAQNKLKASNGDMAKAAKELGVELKTSDLVTRTTTIEGFGSAGIVGEAFRKPVGSVTGPVRAGMGSFFFKVLEKAPADMTQFPAQRAQILDEAKQARARQRNELFREGVVRELTKQKKVRIYEDNIKRLVAAYSS